MLTLACCLLLAPVAAAADAPLPWPDEYVPAAMKAAGVPGLALVVIKDDKVLLARGFGTRERGKELPVDDRTVFAAGSITKSFTAAALGVAVDKGIMTWDDRVSNWLPGFRLADPAARDVTIRDLLAHRTGLPAYGGDLMFSAGFSREEVARRARYIKPDATGFRGRMAYQNVMYTTAGQAAGVASGATWDEVVNHHFFVPLGMKRTVTSVALLPKLENVARPHARVEGEVFAIAPRNIDGAGGAGVINTSAADLACWLRLHLAGGTFEGRRVLSEATVKEMQTPQSVVRVEGWRAKLSPEASFRSYGLGWFLEDFRGRKLVSHGGNVDGMSAQVGMVPSEKLGVVVLSNLDSTFVPKAIMYRAIDEILLPPGGTRRDWTTEFQEVWQERHDKIDAAEKKTEQGRAMGTKPSLQLARYAGTYGSELYGPLEVLSSDDGLTLKYGPRLAGRLEHWHHDTFLLRWNDKADGRLLATFPLDSRGQIVGVRLEELYETGGDWEFPRLPDKLTGDR
jgi:CubicO group peptidase (beta-lactamase class C family)